MNRYAKTLAAVIGAVVTVGGVVLSQHLVSGKAEHWVTVVVAACTALAASGGVFAVPNSPAVPSVAHLLASVPPARTELLTSALPDPANIVTTFDPVANVRAGISYAKEAAVPIAVLPDPQFQAALDAYPKLAGKLEPNAGKHKKPDGTVMTVPEYVAWLTAGCLSAR